MIILKKENTNKLVKAITFLYLLLAILLYGTTEMTIYPQALGILLTIIFLLNIGNKKVKINFPIPLKILAIFIFVTFLGTIFGTDSLGFFSTVFQVFILLTLLFNILINSNSHEFFYWGVIIGTLITIIWQIIEGRMIFGTRVDELTRLGGSVGNANDYALVLSVSINFLLFSFYNTAKKKKMVYWNMIKWTIILFFILECIFFSGSKSGIILISISLLVFFIIKFNKTSFIRKILLFVAGLILISVMTPRVALDAIVFDRFENLINFSMSNKGQIFFYDDGSSEQRLNLIVDGIRLWTERPFFGWGTNEYRFINKVTYDCYSHNNFIEILVNFGLLGFFLFYFIHFYLFKKLLKLKKLNQRNDEVNWLLLMLFSLLIIDITFVTYYNKIYFLVLAFILANTMKLEKYFKIKRLSHTNLN
jgi:O-antigen ligase